MSSSKVLQRFVPGVRWARNYSYEYAISDAIAGITVGLTVLPQALAYATLAGLQPQYGLYSAFVGCIVYAFFGGCADLTIGPTALLALMTGRHTELGGESGPHLAILLCFLAGVVEMLMAFLKLGALVDLISLPVSVGFTSATAVIIASSQLKGLLGIQGNSATDFISTIGSFFGNLQNTRLGDAVLGISSVIILLLLRKLKDIKVPANAKKKRRIFHSALWLIATARNALIVLVASVIAFQCERSGTSPFILTGTVRSGIPDFAFPRWQTTVLSANGTMVDMNLGGMISELGSSVLLVPVIAVLGNVAISKAFGGSGIDATQELVALSLANVFGSFVSSIPVTGSFSRSAVNHASGVKTPYGGLYTSALVLLALGILTPYFRYIPKAALSAVIISAVMFMIEYEVVKPLWRCNKRELLTGSVTFILSLIVGVEFGLLAGVLTDVAFVVQRAARPGLSINKTNTVSNIQYVLVRPKHSLLYFPAVEWVRNGISNAVKQHGNLPMVLDCRNLNEFDYTVVRGLEALYKELGSMKVPLILLGTQEAVKNILTGATNVNIPDVSNEHELDELLQEMSSDGIKDLKEVLTPLIKCKNQNPLV
ncbi:sodium-independent sulfate anion transporter-like [Bradysia coprophila]|uniref:sodium-independent sulfate anion transporter-like n=1 Tax=Bradysia coprophila TaxID=38358 RepID=UPI00187D7A0C|nr:sodium-independent sulfate anion transporter-like [Bradysia coprophila]XP_037034347.1 sodium-independent sulfate anion transporter-like [Bradysia coprophila]